MKVFKRSKAYGALEYTLIIALIIVIAILILNFIRNRTHGVTWIDSASDKVSEYIGGSSGGPGGTPVGSNIELYFPATKPVFDIKEGETLTKEQIKQYMTDNNGVVRNKTTLAEIGAYEIEDITYNPFDTPVYIQFKVTSLEGDVVSQIPGNILAELADGCVLATDADFTFLTIPNPEPAEDSIMGLDEFVSFNLYVGSSKCVRIPDTINGTPVVSTKGMFMGTDVEKVISDNENISDMSGMFLDSQAISLDLSNLKTSGVVDMRGMFARSKANDLNVLNLDTTNVENMSNMFAETSASSIKFGTKFVTSNTINMFAMFFDSKATSLDLSNFDTENVINMRSMFYNSQATSIDLSSFNTANVTTMYGMFQGSKATSLDLSSFNTSNVTNMSFMFRSSQAASLDLSSFDTLNVTDMSWMFASSIAMTLDLSSFDTSNVIDMTSMFENSKITTIDLSDFDFGEASIGSIFEDAQTTEVFVKDLDSKTKLDNFSNKPAYTEIKIKP